MSSYHSATRFLNRVFLSLLLRHTVNTPVVKTVWWQIGHTYTTYMRLFIYACDWLCLLIPEVALTCASEWGILLPIPLLKVLLALDHPRRNLLPRQEKDFHLAAVGALSGRHG